jgi:hypothetical protein
MHRNSIFFILALVHSVWMHPVHGQQSPLLRNRAKTNEVMTYQQVDATSITKTRDLKALSGILDLMDSMDVEMVSDEDKGFPKWAWSLVALGIVVLAVCCKFCSVGARKYLEQQDAKAVDPRENTDEENPPHHRKPPRQLQNDHSSNFH